MILFLKAHEYLKHHTSIDLTGLKNWENFSLGQFEECERVHRLGGPKITFNLKRVTVRNKKGRHTAIGSCPGEHNVKLINALKGSEGKIGHIALNPRSAP